MTDTAQVWFEPFRLDVLGELLWRGQERLSLSPKAFAILHYLAERPGQLVSKTALLEAVWPDAVVGSAVLTVGIAELRKVLGDNPRAPRFIETVHRRGYRFIAPLSPPQPVVGRSPAVVGEGQSTEAGPQLDTGHWLLPTRLVGREAEMLRLSECFRKARSGKRQAVFVTGETGSGKTALVETFLQSLESGVRGPESEKYRETSRAQTRDPRHRTLDAEVWIGHGQCSELYSAGEAYLPVLDALGRLCRAPGGAEILEALRHYAPTWLLQMPALLSASERDLLRQHTYGATRERMLRELADAIAAFAVTRPLVLVFEDLQWSDYATLDFLTTLARRQEPAQLLVIGTYRPGDVLRGRHPLRAIQQELYAHQFCVMLPLAGLTGADIATHLTTRFPHHRFPAAFPHVLYQRTNGNPLFLINLLEELQARAAIIEQDGHWDLAVDVETVAIKTPASIRPLIDRQVERLRPAEQQVLEGASVMGVEFAVGAVAAALAAPLPHVEEQCEQLARQGQFLRAADIRELPDGTRTAQYAFVHALYQETMYDRIGAARRIRLHQSIAHWLETVSGDQAVDIAAELAVHYEQGREYERAVRYLEHAARKAMRRGAAYEAIRHLRAALRLLSTIPQTTGHTECELTLQTLLAPALITAKGYGTVEVEQIYDRVHVLARQVGESPRVFPVLVSVAAFHVVRGEYRTAQEIATQLLQVAQRERDPGLLVEAHALMGVVAFYLGDFPAARAQLEHGMALYDPRQHRDHALQYGQDPWVACCSYLAWTLWSLGYPDRAQERSRNAIAYAQELHHPMSLAFALGLAAILQNVCRDPRAGYDRAEELITLASEHGLPYWVAQGAIARARALVQSGRATEGLAQIQQVLQARREKDGLGRRPSFAILAEAYKATGEPEAGLQALAEAQATGKSDGERYLEAEVYRLKGELLLMREGKRQKQEKARGWRLENGPHSQAQSPQPLVSNEAETCFTKALEVARRQQAKSLELQAATSLARLWQRQGNLREARTLLSGVYHWFTEGFEAKDLQEAKALLDDLSANSPIRREGTLL